MENALKILQEIKRDYVKKFDGDPNINRICNVIISEFEIRTKQLTPTAVVQVKPEVCDEDGMTEEEVQTWKDWYEMYSPKHK